MLMWHLHLLLKCASITTMIGSWFRGLVASNSCWWDSGWVSCLDIAGQYLLLSRLHSDVCGHDSTQIKKVTFGFNGPVGDAHYRLLFSGTNAIILSRSKWFCVSSYMHRSKSHTADCWWWWSICFSILVWFHKKQMLLIMMIHIFFNLDLISSAIIHQGGYHPFHLGWGSEGRIPWQVSLHNLKYFKISNILYVPFLGQKQFLKNIRFL